MHAMDALTSTFLPNSPQLMNMNSPRIPKDPHFTITNSHFRYYQQLVKQNETLAKIKEPIVVGKGQSFLDKLYHSCDEFIRTHIDSPLHPSIDPKDVLSGIFSPVTNELPPTPCDVVEGSLPSCLDGVYIRNGPNPQFIPRGPYHFFDGDGMLHMVKISQGKATLCSRYVRTYKYNREHEMGYSFFPSIFSSFSNGIIASLSRVILHSVRVLSGQFNPVVNGFGTANTSLALFADNLFALCESDLPYALQVTSDGDIITLGRHDFYSTTPFNRMTAHPKVDSTTGEVFAYRYDIMHPFLKFFRIDSKGRKQADVPISSVRELTVIHDFAVTKNYAIFPDIQIVVNPLDIVRGLSPVRVDPTRIPRLGIIPRYANDESEMWWIDVPGFNLMHAINSWEEEDGDIIVIVGTNIVSINHILTNFHLADFSLEKVIIDVKEKTVRRQSLSSINLDMGVVNPAYASQNNRYVYAAVIDSSRAWSSGVAKIDLSISSTSDHACESVVATRTYGPGCWGCEPFFVAKEPSNPLAEEDDGYLMTFVHNENTQESMYLVMDAKSPILDTIAAVKLPSRVPFGFHGLFVSENDLNKLWI